MCSDIPGEFRWQPGALTQAVQQGRWALLEDVDHAPFEVLSAIVSLLERRRLFLPGRGDVVEAAPGFQLFATRTTTASSQAALSSEDGSRPDARERATQTDHSETASILEVCLHSLLVADFFSANCAALTRSCEFLSTESLFACRPRAAQRCRLIDHYSNQVSITLSFCFGNAANVFCARVSIRPVDIAGEIGGLAA